MRMSKRLQRASLRTQNVSSQHGFHWLKCLEKATKCKWREHKSTFAGKKDSGLDVFVLGQAAVRTFLSCHLLPVLPVPECTSKYKASLKSQS